MTAADYCRQVETYLCSKNEGHLVRVVGPAFEQVCGWAAQGVPLKVVFRGIDRYCERYYAKGPRRRPVRIEFCEADILELFDDWRRAVGVTGSGPGRRSAEREGGKEPLVTHIERVIARLTGLRAGGTRTPEFDEAVNASVRELDRLVADARHARGDARATIIARLEELEAVLADAARADMPQDALIALQKEADAELAPFGARMDPAARARAVDAALRRLVRETAGLPAIRYE